VVEDEQSVRLARGRTLAVGQRGLHDLDSPILRAVALVVVGAPI
jgi:hypothetical protein